MTLYLVRHGQTDWNVEPARCQGWAEVPINETGRRQTRELATTLAGRGIDLMVTSHLLRATQTTEELRDALRDAEGHEIAVTIDPRLAETFRGAWQGRTFGSIISSEPATWVAYREHPESFRFPQGESLVEQQRRVLAAVRDAALTGRTGLLVTHNGSIRLVRVFLDGMGIEGFHHVKPAEGEVLALDADRLAARIDRFLDLAAAPDENAIAASDAG